ncbi:MAG: hypothetical protein HY730_05445 [Candidatus Tectomicrobia bacterium]|uniref:Uncharacterized protein n=1 Tax=Tectimicrobiota bacterium TaxID=2528274 RepID=A0A933GN65_UNCTE|nr:hypothetical protein [Candidatus Tectomicrobia bacterium]
MNSQKERMINLLFDDGGPIDIAVGNTSDPLYPKLLIRTSICDNPDCNCREVWLEGVFVSIEPYIWRAEPESI